jgi:hypothetical protein
VNKSTARASNILVSIVAEPARDGSTSLDMMTKQDVLDRKELQLFKFEREKELYDRHVNMTNHAWCHRCSNYCWKAQKIEVDYDEANPEHANDHPDMKGMYVRRDGTKVVKLVCYECRMGFGYRRKFGLGPDRDRTGGAERVDEGMVNIDANGSPKYVSPRNHPRIVAEPIMTRYWAANSDFQRFLTNGKGYEGDDKEGYCRNLDIAGLSGLEQSSGAINCLNYCCGYCCKGNKSSLEWDKVLNQVTEAYMAQTAEATEEGEQTSMYKVVSRYMAEISKSRDVPKDEALFIQAGGKLVMNTMTVKMCSVSSIGLDEITTDGAAPGFKFKSIVTAYKKRGVELDLINLYIFAAHHYGSNTPDNPVAPNFMGFDQRPVWSLKEDWAKTLLMLYHPWRVAVDELLQEEGDTFAKLLEAYMWTSEFPSHIRTTIYRQKTQWKFESSAAGALQEGNSEVENTPSDERQNAGNEEAMAAAVDHETAGYVGQDREEDADLREVDFQDLHDGGDDHDWSVNYQEGAEDWLRNYASGFYAEQNAATVAGVDDAFELFDPAVFKPENCRGIAQKLLLGMVMLQLKRYEESTDENGNLPPSFFIYVQGNPGTGKTFTTRTILNVIRQVKGAMGYALAVAPTGTAASLTRGKTTVRAFKIPVGKKGAEMPTDLADYNIEAIQAHLIRIRKVFAVLKDEHSMDPRSQWTYMQCRSAEARRFIPQLATIQEEREVGAELEFVDRLAEGQRGNITAETSQRPWGGPPVAMSFGDCGQLPPVGAKAHYDRSPAVDGNHACAMGRVVFKEFLDPPEDSGCLGFSVVMDEIIRQSDPEFKGVIQMMRDGTMDRAGAQYCLDRSLGNLSEEERRNFEQTALYIMPTWKRTMPITKQYLKDLEQAVARIDCQYTYMEGRPNHAAKECKMPVRNALCKYASVMLLQNFVVEQELKNGSIGTVVEVVYKEPAGPRQIGNLPAYVVVDFPDSLIDPARAWDPDNPTWVPIPATVNRCEKKCCSQKAVPLRVCKAISIHKSQGATVGPSSTWKRVVVGMPAKTGGKTPGLEMVAFSRAESKEVFAIADDIPLDIEMFMKIGQGKAYEARREFEERIRQRADRDEIEMTAMVKAVDPSPEDEKTFDGGFEALVHWLRGNISL